MHENSEWGRGMHRTDSYWRPPAGFYYPGSSPGRNWTPNGRYTAHSYTRYPSPYNNRYTDNRSHGFKWHNFHGNQHQNHYIHSDRPGISNPMSMAQGYRKGKGRGRGGSRPFPSKLMEKTEVGATASFTASSTNQSHSKSSTASTSSSTTSSTLSSSTTSSSHQSISANTSSRPDQKGSQSSLKYENSLDDVKIPSANVPSTPPVYSPFSSSRSSTKDTSSTSSASSTSSSASFAVSKPQKSTPNVAQSYSVSVSSSNLQKMKFFKKSISGHSDPIPLSTLAYCESIPILREILHKKPVVVLESLTEKVIRRKLKHAGLHLHGHWYKLLVNKKHQKKQVHKKGHADKRNEDKYHKKSSLKLVLSKGKIDKKRQNSKKDSSKRKYIKGESLDSENILETKETKTNSSLLVDPKVMPLVDPKVMSLSRPLQTAYSNNSSVTKMPFKNSGRGKHPSKTIHSKPSGPVPRHMQIFDLDKLRTKLKGANFGGSSRKPRTILNTQPDNNNAEIFKPPVEIIKADGVTSSVACNPDSIYDFTTSPADSTEQDVGEDSKDTTGTADIYCNADEKTNVLPIVDSHPAVKESSARKEDAAGSDSLLISVTLIEPVENQSLDNMADRVSDANPEKSDDSVKETENNEYVSHSKEKTDSIELDESTNCVTDVCEEVEDQCVSLQSATYPEDDSTSEDQTLEKADIFPDSVSSPSEDSPGSQSPENVNDSSDKTVGADTSNVEILKDSQGGECLDSFDDENNTECNDTSATEDDEKKNSISDTEQKTLASEVSVESAEKNIVSTDSVQSDTELDGRLHIHLGESTDNGETDNHRETEKIGTKDVEANNETIGISAEGGSEKSIGNKLTYEQQGLQSHDTASATEGPEANDDRQSMTETVDVFSESNDTVDVSSVSKDKQGVDTSSSLEILDDPKAHLKENTPVSLTEICRGVLRQQDNSVDTIESCGKGPTTDSSLLDKTPKTHLPDLEVCLNGPGHMNEKDQGVESNSQCLMDMVSDASSKALDLSSSKSDDRDDVSPMCIITNVESGAHKYFSEVDSDFRSNSLSIKQEKNEKDAKISSSSSFQLNLDSGTTTAVSSSVTTQPRQNNIIIAQQALPKGLVQVSNVTALSSLALPSAQPIVSAAVATGIPGLYSPAIAGQYPLVLTPSVQVYPVPLVSSVVQPVLVTSPSKDPPRQSSSTLAGPRSPKRDLKLSSKQRPIKPKGTEPFKVVLASGQISPGPIFPMFLPNVPSVYPADDNDDTRVGFVLKDHQNSAKLNSEIFRTSNSSPGQKESVSTSNSDHCLKENPEIEGVEGSDKFATDSTIIQAENHQAAICAVSHQKEKNISTSEARMVSDLDVMHYNEEPPVLFRMNNTDLDVRDEAGQLPDIQYFDGSFVTVTASSDTGMAHSVYLSAGEPQSSSEVDEQTSSSAVLHDQNYVVLISGCQTEHSMKTTDVQESQDDEIVVKTERVSDERVEVGRLNLRRAHGEGSDDSDATLIYSCDEDNTCIEEIFQEPISQPWPKNAPWTENENPSLYEGKLVIVSDIADDCEGDGESTSDTNINNERLSLIITTLRKDLEEKKTDRRQSEKTQTEEAEDNLQGEGKMSKVRKKRRKAIKSRKRAPATAALKDGAKDSTFKDNKKRKNLIVTIQRKLFEKDISVCSVSEHLTEAPLDNAVVDDAVVDTPKANIKKVTKPKRRIKRRLTVKRRKKKVNLPKVEAEVTEDAVEEDKPKPVKKIPRKIGKIQGKKNILVSKLRGKKKKKKKKKKDRSVLKDEDLPEKKEGNMTDSDDSDELPTILPPKRRRLQSNGNPLMMMQNSVGKGNSSERIMRELPRHNWLEQKINQLQQQASCSPSYEEDISTQGTLQQSPTHVNPPKETLDNPQKSIPDEENVIPDLASAKPSSPTKDSNAQSEVAQACTASQENDACRITVTNAAAPSGKEILPEKDSISLHEALRLVGADDTEGQLVIDEGDPDETSTADSMPIANDEEQEVQTAATKQISEITDQDPVLSNPDSEVISRNDSENSEVKTDTSSENTGTGLPLDLCLKKSDKTCGGSIRPKAHPPVQMVLPQIQQPARPVSTDPTLVKDTKEIVQNIVVQSSENNSSVCSEITQSSMNEALNLSSVSSGQPKNASIDFAELAKGVVMPVVESEAESDVTQQMENSSAQLTPNSQGPVSMAQLQASESGDTTIPTTSGTSAQPAPVIPPKSPLVTIPGNMPVPIPLQRPSEYSMGHGGQVMQTPVPIPAPIPHPAPGTSHGQPFPYQRPCYPPRSNGDNILDKEFEKHLKEFKQLEMLAARKEREREALLHLKKRKALLLKEMKYMKNQQSSDSENLSHGPPPAHNGSQYGAPPHFPNTQHRAQVAELQPFQNVPLTMTGPQQQVPNHSLYTTPMSQTYTTPSSTRTGPLGLDASNQRKRSMSSEDRRPLVHMINLAMLQRGRKHRRPNDDPHRSGGMGMSSSGSVPTPAHQNKTEVVLNHDADVPTSEITQCPYVKRKIPILEPPGSVSRSAPASAALVPAHSQQPFQTAGSLIVPARNGSEENIPPSYPSASPHPAGNTLSPGSHPQSYPQPNPVSSVNRNPPVNEIHSDPITKSKHASDSAYNVLHVSQDHPMPYAPSGERGIGNTNPPPYPLEHFGNAPPQWSPRMPNPVSQTPRFPPQSNYHGNPSIRQTVAQSLHRQPHPLAARPERGMDVIDLTKEQDPSRADIMRHMVVGGGPEIETESTVQRELTAALARRQGMGFEQPQQPQQHPQMMRRNQDVPTTPQYAAKTYPGHNPLSPQGMTQVQHPNQMYPHQGAVQGGNTMTSQSDANYSIPNRQSAVGSQYRMQEPTSIKSALLSHTNKQMMCPPNYPMNTSASSTASYPAPHYQQQRNMNKAPQQMMSNNPLADGYPRMTEKTPMMPGQMPHHQQPPGYNEHMPRTGQTMTSQYKPPQQTMNWRPQVPTSVSNVPMSLEKQQQLMMMTRKTQWEQYSQQKHALAQKNASHPIPPSNPGHAMQTTVSTMPQVPGASYAMAASAQGHDPTSMQQRAAMHQHTMRMMQHGQTTMAAQMQAKMQSVQGGYPREQGMMIPGQNPAPALIEFQQQESQRRMPQMPMTQAPPRLHQFNGSCVVCGALAMYLCSSCRMVWYCSQTCQNNHWKRHGPECKPVKPPGLSGQL